MDLPKIKKEISATSSIKELDNVYHRYLGRKGEVALLLRKLGGLSADERKRRAPKLQKLKRDIDAEVAKRKEELKEKEIEGALAGEWIDVTAPGERAEAGHLHPLTKIQNEINEIFTSLGFEIAEGPEIETEWYNFDALNIPEGHPARDLWDTFWLRRPDFKSRVGAPTGASELKLLLRTHTSPVQVRYMETHQPPLRIVAPGRAFRHEASDASHDFQFYQIEGLMVDKDISVANFKAVIDIFFKKLFGENIKTRLRPSFFPFVEPGFEVDMSCANCNGKGCSVCSKSGWLEMMGAGMVHPSVFKAAGLNPKFWQGFAFGGGIDRIAMMKYKIDDIRLLYNGDLRFLKQF